MSDSQLLYKRLRKSPRKYRRMANQKSVQRVLFDDNGYVPINVAEEVCPVAGKHSTFNVAGMQLELLPTPINLEWAVLLVLDALRLLHLTSAEWWPPRAGTIAKTVSIDTEICTSAEASFRFYRGNVTIQAQYNRTTEKLKLTLPIPSDWPQCGLEWLPSYRHCCQRHREDPAPWRLTGCNCQSENTEPTDQ